jgi:hypothetical protein
MQCGRMVFYTFRRCMSFHTARVKCGKAQSEHVVRFSPMSGRRADALTGQKSATSRRKPFALMHRGRSEEMPGFQSGTNLSATPFMQ